MDTTVLCFPFGFIALFIGYYLTCVVRKPQIVSKPKSYISLLIKQSCPFVNQFYWPTFWCFEGRTQTVVGSILKTHPSVNYHREVLYAPDGGMLSLDWVNTDHSSTPLTLLILPGLTGTSDHHYIRHFVLQATQQLDCRVGVLNNRGLGGLPLKTPRVCCAADTDDLEYVIYHIKKTKPTFPVIVVGISLGGIILTNLLCKIGDQGNHGLNKMILGAAVISTPWNLFKTTESLEQPLNQLLFNRHLTKLLQTVLKQHLSSSVLYNSQIAEPFDINQALSLSTVREFDDKVIAPLSGYRDCNEYYTAATLHLKPLEKICVPLLCLNAADDPFTPVESIPLELLQRCPNIALVLTKYGGHVAFTEGMFPRGSGYMERVVLQYVQALCKPKLFH